MYLVKVIWHYFKFHGCPIYMMDMPVYNVLKYLVKLIDSSTYVLKSGSYSIGSFLTIRYFTRA